MAKQAVHALMLLPPCISPLIISVAERHRSELFHGRKELRASPPLNTHSPAKYLVLCHRFVAFCLSSVSLSLLSCLVPGLIHILPRSKLGMKRQHLRGRPFQSTDGRPLKGQTQNPLIHRNTPANPGCGGRQQARLLSGRSKSGSNNQTGGGLDSAPAAHDSRPAQRKASGSRRATAELSFRESVSIVGVMSI